MHILENESLSLKAKGLYMVIKLKIMTCGSFRKSELIEMSKDGTGSFESAWKELKSTGYLIQERDNKNNSYKYELKSNIEKEV